MSSRNLAVLADGLSKLYYRGLTSRTRITERRTNDKSQSFWALKDVSFEVSAGTVVGFIGPNGAGKSTLLKILARVTPPTSGWAKILGTTASLIEVGTGFHPELTGRENIYLSAAIHGMSSEITRSRLNEIVDFAGVGGFVDTPVKRYSSGMYVRLGFAVAAHIRPEVLIVDEVLAVGDVAFQARCLERVSELRDAGTAILWVSHDLDQVQRLCDSVSLLKGGELVATGPPADVVGRYRTDEGLGGVQLEGVLDLPRQVSAARISSVEVQADPSDSNLATGQPFSLAVELDVAEGSVIDDLNVGIWIHDEVGRLLIGTNTELLSCAIPPVSEGRLRVVFQFAYAPLKTGRYIVSSALEGAHGTRYDQVTKAREFHVVDHGTAIGAVGFLPRASCEVLS